MANPLRLLQASNCCRAWVLSLWAGAAGYPHTAILGIRDEA